MFISSLIISVSSVFYFVIVINKYLQKLQITIYCWFIISESCHDFLYIPYLGQSIRCLQDTTACVAQIDCPKSSPTFEGRRGGLLPKGLKTHLGDSGVLPKKSALTTKAFSAPLYPGSCLRYGAHSFSRVLREPFVGRVLWRSAVAERSAIQLLIRLSASISVVFPNGVAQRRRVWNISLAVTVPVPLNISFYTSTRLQNIVYY